MYNRDCYFTVQLVAETQAAKCNLLLTDDSIALY